MSEKRITNLGRWLLATMAIGFGMVSIGMILFPEAACPSYGSSRTMVEELIQCPSFTGESPIAEVLQFSLGKHLFMIGTLLTYFAIFSRSKATINAALIYFPVALALDGVPVWTWLGASGATTSMFPPVLFVAIFACVLGGAGLFFNNRHPEWDASDS